MRKAWANILRSYKTIYAWFTDYTAVVVTYEALAEIMPVFKALVDEIVAKEAKFLSAAKGMAALGRHLKNEVNELLFPLAGALYLVARDSGDAEMQGFLNLCKSDLIRPRQTELPVIMKKIVDYALLKITELPKFKYTPEQIDLISVKVLEYSSFVSKKDRAIEIRKGILKEMKDKFAAVELLLDEDLDRLVELVKAENIAMYNEYFGARSIKDLGIRHEEEGTTPPPAGPTN